MLAHYENQGISCPVSLQALQVNRDQFFSQLFSIYLDQQPIGTLYLESSRGALLERFNQFVTFSLIILAITVVMAILLANRLQEVVLRPMRELSNALTAIVANKDYSIRATKENADELGDLVDLFNGLLRTIEAEKLIAKNQ